MPMTVVPDRWYQTAWQIGYLVHDLPGTESDLVFQSVDHRNECIVDVRLQFRVVPKQVEQIVRQSGGTVPQNDDDEDVVLTSHVEELGQVVDHRGGRVRAENETVVVELRSRSSVGVHPDACMFRKDMRRSTPGARK